MSIERVAEFAPELPPKLRENVVGYARSVDTALPDVFRNARSPKGGTFAISWC